MTKAPINNDYVSRLQKQIGNLASKIVQKKQSEIPKFGSDVYEITLRTVSSVEDQSYNLVDAKAAYSLIGQNVPVNSGYVAEIYQNNSRVDNSSTIVEGLVFKNNREFDFKV